MYWIPVYQILESRGLEACLVNAQHVKNVPGRKADESDCQWDSCRERGENQSRDPKVGGFLGQSHSCCERTIWKQRFIRAGIEECVRGRAADGYARKSLGGLKSQIRPLRALQKCQARGYRGPGAPTPDPVAEAPWPANASGAVDAPPPEGAPESAADVPMPEKPLPADAADWEDWLKENAGIALRGMAADGIAVRGIAVDGITVRGIAVDGIAVRGIAVDGMAMRGMAALGIVNLGIPADGKEGDSNDPDDDVVVGNAVGPIAPKGGSPA